MEWIQRLVYVYLIPSYFVLFAAWNIVETSMCKQQADNMTLLATRRLIDLQGQTHRLATHKLFGTLLATYK